MKHKLIAIGIALAFGGGLSGLIVAALLIERGYIREQNKLRHNVHGGESTTPVALKMNGFITIIPVTNAGVWVRKTTNQYEGGLFIYDTNEPKVLRSDMNPLMRQTITDAIDPTLKPGDRLIVDAKRNIVRDIGDNRTNMIFPTNYTGTVKIGFGRTNN